ncbi:hypothetical protein FGG08_005826 [Glutinoglossum americanum]|uniref:Uncharacterized protein n=1 Tax=Glutinoglossum americanum TaxID=1670608 RepID=A0A9P8HXF9_9PEZI|nr:hypothetical protein FGG08_005826 [Glutinoglossum americanum]
MSSINSNPAILSDRDVNTSEPKTIGGESSMDFGPGNKKSLEYHRQMLQSKLKNEDGVPQYVSPSDGIMSPCTAKLSAYKNKHFMK